MPLSIPGNSEEGYIQRNVAAISKVVGQFSPDSFEDYLFSGKIEQISSVNNWLVRELLPGVKDNEGHDDKVLAEAKLVAAKVTLKVTATIISAMLSKLNLHQNMTPVQIVACAKAINQKYWYLSYCDLKHFSDRLLNGEFGPVKVSIDQPTIMRALEKFEKERTEVIENKREIDRNHLAESQKGDWGDGIKSMLHGLKERLTSKKPKKKRVMHPALAEAKAQHEKSIEYLKENDPDFSKKYGEKYLTKNQ